MPCLTTAMHSLQDLSVTTKPTMLGVIPESGSRDELKAAAFLVCSVYPLPGELYRMNLYYADGRTAVGNVVVEKLEDSISRNRITVYFRHLGEQKEWRCDHELWQNFVERGDVQFLGCIPDIPSVPLPLFGHRNL